MSILVLMRCTTGESWNKIMHELAIDKDTPIFREKSDGTIVKDYCIENQTYE